MCKWMNQVSYLSVAAVFLCSRLSATASILPDAEFFEAASATVPTEGDSGFGSSLESPELIELDVSWSPIDAPDGDKAQAIISLGTYGASKPLIDVQAQVSSTASGSSKVTAAADIDFWFMIMGPDTPGSTVQMSASAFIDATGSANGFGSWGMITASIDAPIPGLREIRTYWGDAPVPATSPPGGDVQEDFSTLTGIIPNTSYKVAMSMSGEARTIGLPDGSSAAADFQVVVDPVFTFVNPEDEASYSIFYSANIPEPGSLALLVLGGLLVAHRRGSCRWASFVPKRSEFHGIPKQSHPASKSGAAFFSSGKACS